MAELANEFSWSRSRDATFQDCRRKYFYQYYGAWGGWDPGAPPDVRRLYILKQLSSRQQWAGRIVHDAGHQLHATNRTRVKAQPLIERGLVWQETPRAVAAASDVVLSMVTDDAALDAVTGEPDGILAGLAAGKIYIDMSTASPENSRALAERVSELGAHMLDAPVSGSVITLEQGKLTVMVGGDEAVFERARPVLEAIGPKVFHVGANGAAVTMKIAMNLSLAVQMLAFSEGVLLAEKSGIPREKAVEVMLASVIASPMVAYLSLIHI